MPAPSSTDFAVLYILHIASVQLSDNEFLDPGEKQKYNR